MKVSVKTRFCRWDALTAAVIVLLATACAGLLASRSTGGGRLTAVVSVDGTETDRIVLSGAATEKTYTSRGYTLHVLARDGEIRVSEADCPNHDCVRTGAITRPGQSIVCLPARISIQLVGTGGSGDVDLVLG